MKTKIRIIVWLMALLLIISTIMGVSFNVLAAGYEDVAVSNSIYLDDDGNFVFLSYDKKKTSTTSYKTVGFTISRCIQVDKEEYVPEEYVVVPLSTTNTPVEVVSETNSHICNKWTIRAEYVMQLISAAYPDWAETINEEDGYYLKFDAVMVVVRNGHPSGMLASNGAYMGAVYDKHTKDALKNAAAWADTGKIDTHFDKYFFVGEMVDEDIIEGTDAPQEDFVERIGKDEPYYRTWNESPGNQFDLSQGIPTSEDVKNGFEVDSWFGTFDVGKHTEKKSYTFTFCITYDTWYYPGDTDGDGIDDDPIQTQASEDYTYTVYRDASYFYIMNMAVYDFKDAYIKNSVYPGDTIVYTGGEDTVDFDVTVNGVENPDIVDTWVPDNNVHIEWAEAEEYTSTITASTLEDGKTAARLAAENAVDQATVHNDRIIINGVEYMSDEAAKGNAPLTYSVIEDEEYGLEEFEETVTIPSNVANGIYPTEMQVRFVRMEPKTLAAKLYDDLHIKEGYENNEPIHVHTPVISPVTIIDPVTGLRYDGEDTQLINENRVNVDYELLLDGTYTFKFDPELHRDIQGYGWSGEPSKYDKYTAFKEVMFPFDVEVNDIFYEKDTWITLPDFEKNTFYIPPWTIESDSYIIRYRVAPENVVDENGINHIDDQEYLHNLDMAAYVATYEIKVEVSGRVYGFQVVGINDRDIFGNDSDGNVNARMSLASEEWEKKTGVKNRIGEDEVRITRTGEIDPNWKLKNTLPFANGISNVYEDMGTLYSGTDFSYTFYTMANLESDGDRIYITPTFRYIDRDGNMYEHDDIDVYYSSDAGKFIKVGSAYDRADVQNVSLSDEEFKDSYTQEELEFTVNLRNSLTGDTMTYKQFVEKETEAYSMSEVVLKNPLRLLAGSYSLLERNLDRPATGSLLNIGGTDEIDGLHYDMLRASIQKWYGTYRIPANLYVHIHIPGEDEDDPAWEYALDHNGISKNSDFWERDGYLVVNFEIMTENEGMEHLEYFPSELEENNGRTSEGTKDQWYIENFGVNNLGQSRTVYAGDDNTEITVRSGDVAVIDLQKNINSRYQTGILIIN